MASRGNTGARAVQKKLKKIVKDVLKSDAMISILDSMIDPVPAFLADESEIEAYGDDIAAFKAEVDKTCKSFSKMRGKKTESSAVAELFDSLIRSEFPQEGGDRDHVEDAATLAGKKRGRPSTGGNEQATKAAAAAELPPKKSTRGRDDAAATSGSATSTETATTTLSTQDKSVFRAILGQLAKLPDAEHFVYPVDRDSYPEYYEAIKHPMDLSTVKEKLNGNRYTGVNDVLADLRQIWQNCRLFNVEGSEILEMAETCADTLEDMVEEKLGKEFRLPKSKLKKLKAEVASVAAAAAAVVAGGTDTGAVGTGEKRRKSSSSSGTTTATGGGGGGALANTRLEWPSAPRRLTSVPRGEPQFSLTQTLMKSMLKEVSSMEEAAFFKYPVDQGMFPDYAELIARPMDFSTIRKQLNSGEYSTSSSGSSGSSAGGAADPATAGATRHPSLEFVRDMRLVWENCVAYNDPGSDIVASAVVLGDAFEELLKEPVDAFRAAAKKAAKEEKEKEKAAEAAAAAGNEETTAAAAGGGGGEGDTKKPVSVNMRKMKKIYSTIYKNEKSVPFRFPVPVEEVPGYAELIAHPMDLSKVKSKMDAYDEQPGHFLRDMRLIFDNCQRFNVEDSDFYKAAGELKELLESMYVELFPPVDPSSSTSSSTAGAGAKAGHKVKDKPVAAGPPVEGQVAAGAAMEKPSATRAPVAVAAVGPATVSSIPTTKTTGGTAIGHKSTVATTATKLTSATATNPGATTTATTTTTTTPAAAPASLLPTSALLPPPPAAAAAAAANLQPKTKAVVAGPRFPQSIEEVNALLNYPKGIREHARWRCFNKAQELVKGQKMPYLACPGLYAVTKFGDLVPGVKSLSVEGMCLHPVGYSCSRFLRICLLPVTSAAAAAVEEKTSEMQEGEAGSVAMDLESSGEGGSGGAATAAADATTQQSKEVVPYVSVDVKCTVVQGSSFSTDPNALSYLVSLENGTLISEATTPKKAWEGVFGKELEVLRVLGSKLHRCKAVFNRLAVSPDALPMYEMVPIAGPVGKDYYSVITAPMWFQEVQDRLMEGNYDCEFDFAWDMRLIFKNCMEYNAPKSELHEAAQRLSELFEVLFVNWVINVQDRHVREDIAKGPWDEWASLRHFDSDDPSMNICAVTRKRGLAGDMLQCYCCEDQNLASLHPEVKRKSGAPPPQWACGRCQAALEETGQDLRNKPASLLGPGLGAGMKSSRSSELYSCEDFGHNAYTPSADCGLGWSQALRRFRGGLKNAWLSPLGYEVFSHAEVLAQTEYEETINQNLYLARAAEFQETKNSNKPRKERKKTARHKRQRAADVLSPEKSGHSSSSSNGGGGLDLGSLEEEGRISTGKLFGFKVPEGYRLAWYAYANEDQIVDRAQSGEDVTALLESSRVEMTAELLPLLGYFGLDVVPIRRRIESLDGSLNYAPYSFLDTEKYAQEVIDELKAHLQKFEILKQGETELKAALLAERWSFDKLMMSPPRPVQAEPCPVTAEHRAGFSPLLPPHVTARQGETLLALWEFLHLLGTTDRTVDAYSFHDLLCSLSPPSAGVPNYGQVVFDEICSSFCAILFQEVRYRCNEADNKVWQKVLMARPMNIITWPNVALEAIRILSFPLAPGVEVKTTLSMPLLPLQQLQRDLVCLLFNHPLIDTFLVQVPDASCSPELVLALNSLTQKLRGLKDHFSVLQLFQDDGGPGSVYADIVSLCTYLREIFLDIAQRGGGSGQEEKETEPEKDGNNNNNEDVDAITSTPSLSASAAVDVRCLHALGILHWLELLFARWGVALPECPFDHAALFAEKGQKLREEKLDPWRFWGGYILSNIDVPKDGMLLVENFDDLQVLSDYDRRMEALSKLERCLFLLARSEPESWGVEDRTCIYATLVDHCMVTRESTVQARQRVEPNLAKYSNVERELPVAEVEEALSLEAVRPAQLPAGAKCCFTGLEVDPSLAGVTWVTVPEEYERLPFCDTAAAGTASTTTTAAAAGAMEVVAEDNVSNTSSSSSTRGTRAAAAAAVEAAANAKPAGRIALQGAMIKVAAARLKATTEAAAVSHRITDFLRNTLYEEANANSLSKFIFRTHLLRTPSLLSKPLGYDRYGNAYWLLSVQQYTTLFPHQANGVSCVVNGNQAHEMEAPVEPCVLMRDVSGWWGYFVGPDHDALLERFNPNNLLCEKILFLKMIESLAHTRCILHYGNLMVKNIQREWMVRRIRAETSLAQGMALLEQQKTPLEINRFLEMMWARAVEVRQYVHTISIYKKEENPNVQTARAEREFYLRRHKKMRDLTVEDSFDVHCISGWSRFNSMGHVRSTAAATSATRIIADPQMYATLSEILKRTPWLQRPPPPPALPPPAAAVELPPPAAALPVAGAVPSAAGAPSVAPVAPEALSPSKNILPVDSVLAPVGDQTTVSAAANTTANTTANTAANTTVVAPASPAPAASAVSVPMEEEEKEEAQAQSGPGEATAAASATSTSGVVDGATTEPPTAVAASTAAATVSEPDSSSSIAINGTTTAIEPTREATTTAAVVQGGGGGGGGEDMKAEPAPEVPAATATGSDASANPIVTAPTTTAAAAIVTAPTTNAVGGSGFGGGGGVDAAGDARRMVKVVGPNNGEEEVVDADLLIPDLSVLIEATTLKPHGTCKAVEQLHLVTGKLIRIYPSGKDAANFLGVSQSGISLCLCDTKPEFFGFAWRWWKGPEINWDALEGRQLSYKAMLCFQTPKNPREPYNEAEERERAIQFLLQERSCLPLPERPIISPVSRSQLAPLAQQPQSITSSSSFSSAAAGAVAMPPAAAGGGGGVSSALLEQQRLYQQRLQMLQQRRDTTTRSAASASTHQQQAAAAAPPPTPNPNQTHLNISDVVVSARMLKLKAELLNMFFLLPEKSLKLPELDEEGEKAVEAAGDEAANSIRAGVAKLAGTQVSSVAPTTTTTTTTTTTGSDADATAADGSAASAVESTESKADDRSSNETKVADAVDASAAAGVGANAMEQKEEDEEEQGGNSKEEEKKDRQEEKVGAPMDVAVAAGTSSSSSSSSSATAATAQVEALPAAEEGDKMKQDKTVAAAVAAGGLDLSQSNVDRLADKASRKAKRRLKRKLAIEKFLKDVRGATTAQQLMMSVLCFEEALPEGQVYQYEKHVLPVYADTLSAVALRLFTIDRAIAYDEIKEVARQPFECVHKLRSQFFPRCMQSSTCGRAICHIGKCTQMYDSGGSRMQEILDFDPNKFNRGPAVGSSMHGGTGHSLHGYGQGGASNHSAAVQMAMRRQQYLQMMAMRNRVDEQPLAENIKKLLAASSSKEPKLDIENIIPYVPAEKDLAASEWL